MNKIAAAVLLVLGSATFAFATVTPPPNIPEPTTLGLLVSGAGAALLYARHRRSRK